MPATQAPAGLPDGLLRACGAAVLHLSDARSQQGCRPASTGCSACLAVRQLLPVAPFLLLQQLPPLIKSVIAVVAQVLRGQGWTSEQSARSSPQKGECIPPMLMAPASHRSCKEEQQVAKMFVA